MSEYEIFNGNEEVEPEIIIEEKQKKIKKEKPVSETKECKAKVFFAKAFSLEHVSISLSIVSLFLTIFVKLVPLSGTVAGIATACVFYVLSLCCGITGLIVEVVKMARQRSFVFSVHLVVVLVALLIASIAI